MANVCFHRWGRIDSPWVVKHIKGIIVCLSLDFKDTGCPAPFFRAGKSALLLTIAGRQVGRWVLQSHRGRDYLNIIFIHSYIY